MIDLKNKNIALVLSGGGAKGAYQIGMLRALEEAGLEKDRLTLAGTSIGALNALLYAIADTDALREMVHTLGNTAESADTFMKHFYPDSVLAENKIPVTVCAYCIEREQAEHFLLNGLPPQEQRDLTLASASLPDLLPCVPYRGFHYLDGGKIPPQCSKNAGPADKIPFGVIRDLCSQNSCPFDIIIISFLKPEDAIDHSWIGPETLYLESRPSEPLENEPGTGTRDYSAERLAKNEKQGYEEMKALLHLL